MWPIKVLIYTHHVRGLKSVKYSQTWANDHLSTTTTILTSRFPHLDYKGTSEQRPPVNNGHNFGVPRVVVVFSLTVFDFLSLSLKVERFSMTYDLRLRKACICSSILHQGSQSRIDIWHILIKHPRIRPVSWQEKIFRC